MSELYSGSSESFQFLSDCYLDYAKEVISRRAIPDLRDGQKKYLEEFYIVLTRIKINYAEMCSFCIRCFKTSPSW